MDRHPTHTQIIYADNKEEAKEKYTALGIKPDHDLKPEIEVFKVTEEEDFDPESPFNLIGEVSLSPEIMEKVNVDLARAYVIYYMEKV
ncbi:hypothetical protein SAMN00017405_2262 [Desulfonispora thiosulfatigenes DSM 11270]|uniref:Uncharacterized protein n=1 Tax=Desulfonispora thiosulfatigenes DSM 11270 TaxID=656914 RepID=A0A1W1VE91_DESTI|nr:hypothetical protein [Desulfonispora thiosulfatigenes]SMB91264.1 hypothetical protein SAMN00017405_2262 [Desulfonispora thiosulfatigenes DSM 11270]